MGEYIKFDNGENYKLGTCESLYYARLDEIKNAVPRYPELKEYLKPIFRYRFPWPDEDGFTLDGRHTGNRAKNDYDRSIIINCSLPDNCDHGHQWFSTSGSYNINVKIPCPNTDNPAFDDKIQTSGREHAYKIIAQKEDEVTVLECLYCGSMFRLQDENVEAVREAIIRNEGSENKDDPLSWWKQVAARVHGEKEAVTA